MDHHSAKFEDDDTSVISIAYDELSLWYDQNAVTNNDDWTVLCRVC
jgi:hypothetical protein